MDSNAAILLAPIPFLIIMLMMSVQSSIRFVGMHRISNRVFLDLIAANPSARVIVKSAGHFTKARHYILNIDGAQLYTRSDFDLDLPESITIIPSSFQHK